MRYMNVDLTVITKAEYYKARDAGPIIASRPLGFITEQDNMRMLYLSDDGKFYRGQLSFVQTNDMFMKMKFNEVKQFIRAQFELSEAVTGS